MPDTRDILIVCEAKRSRASGMTGARLTSIRGMARAMLPGPRSFLVSRGIIGHGLLGAQRLDSLANSDLKRSRSRIP